MLNVPTATEQISKLPQRLFDFLFSSATPRQLKCGEFLFCAGDAGDGCYRIRKGMVKVLVTSQSGDDRIFAMLGPCDVVGELSMIDGLPRSASVVAITDCDLEFITRDIFLKKVSGKPEIQMVLIRTLAMRLREADKFMAAASFLTVKGRVARALLELAAHVGEESNGHILLNHKVNQGDLAALAGVARENVSRVLSEFRRRKIVACQQNRYVITNLAALRQETDYDS